MARWDKLNRTGKVVDRRGVSAGVGGLGIAGVVLYVAVAILGGGDINPVDVLNQLQTAQISQQNVDSSRFEGNDEYEQFASVVLGSNNQVWNEIFSANSKQYVEPTLVLFRNATQSGCGLATAQVGPHYCPPDSTIYLDETFFAELTNRLGAKGGDVAEAYVIAHEVGHHVQSLLGYLDGTARSNDEQIAIELQADCFAGLWAYSLRDEDVFEDNEISEAIDAAAAVGDDRIQESVNGRVNPETWTHGSSEQRVGAFTSGYETGDVRACAVEL